MRALRLQGATVGITGGAGAIGVEIAIMFAGAGARVVIGDIDGEAARSAAALIGERARGHAVDVRDRESMAAFIDALGTPLVFVNNAGLMPLGRYVDEEPAVTRRAVDVNLWGALHGSQLAARGMIARGEGQIVNIASLMGRMTAAGAVTYGAAKHAIVGFGAGFAEELQGTGVTITTVLPTAVRTPLISGLELGRFPPVIEPYEVAAAVLGSCRHRRPEVTVPRYLARTPDVERMMPRAVRARLRRRLGGDAGLRPDAGERADYERRIRRAELVA